LAYSGKIQVKVMTLPILSAILGILALLPVNFYFFGFVFLTPLFIFFLKEERFWRLVLGAFIFRWIFGLGTVHFTLEPITWFLSSLIFLGLPVDLPKSSARFTASSKPSFNVESFK